MLNILESMYSKLPLTNKEAFGNNSSFIPLLLAIITLIFLQLLLGKFLWNGYLVRLVPSIKPVRGLVDILAISVLIRLLVN